MDLEISPIRTRGRAAKPMEVSVVRGLRLADLGLLSEEKGSKAPTLSKRLSSRHHMLARKLAEGLKAAEAGMIAGYSPSRVSILQGDPSFQHLVKFYRDQITEVFVGMHEKLAGLGHDALDVLSERLEDEPESFSNGMLVDIVAKTADRTGHGPTSTQVNLNMGLAERLSEARKRVAAARTIEHKEDEGE